MTQSNHDFLKRIFGDSICWATAFAMDPQEAGDLEWGGRPVNGKAMPDIERGDLNTFYAISSLKPVDGKVKRRQTHFDALHAVILDDIGTKVDKNKVKLPPTYIVRTSVTQDGVGNSQYGYVLDPPCTDFQKAKALIAGLVESGLASDPGMSGVNRYGRMPVGSNTKAKYGRPVPHELEYVDFDVRYSVEQIAEAFGVDLSPAPKKSEKKPFDRKAVLAGVPEGERDDKAYRYACSMHARGIDQAEAEVLIVVAADNCIPPFPREAALEKVRRVYEQGDNDAEADQTTDRRTLGDIDLESMRLVNLKWDIEEPPPVDYLIDQVLPMGTTAVVGAAGGSSKTQLTLQTGIGVGAAGPICPGGFGRLWMPQEPREVLILSAEEDAKDLHRRIHTIVAKNGYTDEQKARMRKNLYLQSVRGLNNLLTFRAKDGSIQHTKNVDALRRLVGQMRDPGLLMVDPLSRFNGGDEIRNDDATRLIEVFERLCDEFGITTWVPAHVNKASLANDELTQDAIRGASGIVDGGRWTAIMRTMTPKEAKLYEVDDDQRRYYVQIAIPKGNNIEPQAPQWLRRGIGGFLMHAKLMVSKEVAADREYHAILKRIVSLLKKHPDKRFAQRTLEQQYAGVEGVLAAGQKKVRAVIVRALEEGALVRNDAEDALGVGK